MAVIPSTMRSSTTAMLSAVATVVALSIPLLAAGQASDRDTSRMPALGVPVPDTLQLLAAEVGPGFDEMVARLGSLRPRPGAFDRSETDGARDGVQRLEIDGLVVDETQTRMGRDFYDVFYSSWEAPEGAVNFTVRIQEQPLPTLGTRVVVLVDDEMLFQLQLQPRYEIIEEYARQAAAYTAEQLEDRLVTDLPAATGVGAADSSGVRNPPI